APSPAQPRERVGDRDARNQQPERREAAVEERVQRVAPQRRLGEDVDVVVPGERLGPEPRRERLVARHQRGEQDEHEREQEHDRGYDQQAVRRDADQEPLPANRDRRTAADEGGRGGGGGAGGGGLGAR